jgi:hypothetical protein
MSLQHHSWLAFQWFQTNYQRPPPQIQTKTWILF